MPYDIEVRRVEAHPVVSIRATTTRDEVASTLAELLPEVAGYLAELGVEPTGPPFARWHDDWHDRTDLDAGLPVAVPVENSGRITAEELPGGEVVSTWHAGPYTSLTSAYSALEAWMREHGRQSAGAPWEVYWTGPDDVTDPAEYRTEVLWPVR